MKNGWMTALVIVTVCAVIGGTIYHVNGFSRRVARALPFVSESEDERISFSEDYGDVTSLTLDCSLCEITVCAGDVDKINVSYEGALRLKPEVTKKGDTLQIEQKSRGINTAGERWMNRVSDYDLTVTVPEDLKLSALTVNLALGDVSISALQAKEISLIADMGEITADTLSGETLTVKASMGNIEVRDASADILDVKASMGNVEMYETDAKEITADVSMGNLTIETNRPLSDYEVDAQAKMGSIEIDGETMKEAYRTTGNYGSIRATADMGNVELSGRR